MTAGEGWHQEEGKRAQLLKPGDVVAIHEGVKHWHGATKDPTLRLPRELVNGWQRLTMNTATS